MCFLSRDSLQYNTLYISFAHSLHIRKTEMAEKAANNFFFLCLFNKQTSSTTIIRILT